MRKINGNALVFDAESVKSAKTLIPRLIRAMFYGLQITNDEFKSRFWTYYKENTPNGREKDFSLKSSSLRTTIADDEKVTIKLLNSAINTMGYKLDNISITVVDNLTGERFLFSTTQSIEDLDKMISERQKTGIGSL